MLTMVTPTLPQNSQMVFITTTSRVRTLTLTAMAIMVRLVLLLISGILIASCGERLPDVVLQRSSVEVKTSKGVTFVNGKIYSGFLVELSPAGDTLSRESFLNGKEHGS